jgi:hypothetical protein
MLSLVDVFISDPKLPLFFKEGANNIYRNAKKRITTPSTT